MKKNYFLLILFSLFSYSTVFSQEYLDKDKRFMKIREISTDNTYGYTLHNPIKIGPEKMAVGAYLNSLNTIDGVDFFIEDVKEKYQNKTGLTQVILSYEQESGTTTLYFSTTEYENPKAITEFSYKTENEVPKVDFYLLDQDIKTEPCSQMVYTTEKHSIAGIYSDQQKPDSNPYFEGGTDELKRYFADHPLRDKRAGLFQFRAAILFLVNCNGDVGNFEMISRGSDESDIVANELLSIVQNMPQLWEPAVNDNKPIDCYQVLFFDVSKGKLTHVSYKE